MSNKLHWFEDESKHSNIVIKSLVVPNMVLCVVEMPLFSWLDETNRPSAYAGRAVEHVQCKKEVVLKCGM